MKVTRIDDSRRIAALNLDTSAIAAAAEAALTAAGPGARNATFTLGGRQFAVSATTINAAAYSVDLIEGQSRQRLVLLAADPALTSGRGRRRQPEDRFPTRSY